MSNQRLGGGDSSFDPGEPEELVREIRGFLRAAQQHRAQGEDDATARARARATSLIGDLARRLERRFERHARATFDEAPDLIDDAVAEMFTELCRRLSDLSGANVLMERRFNFVVKALIVDAIRKVRSHNGLTKDGAPDTGGFTVLSLEAANERAERTGDGGRTSRSLEVVDAAGEDGFARVVERMLGREAVSWLERLPLRQQRIIADRVFGGLSWADVAARSGVSIKTAQTDLEQALSTLRALYRQRLEGGAT